MCPQANLSVVCAPPPPAKGGERSFCRWKMKASTHFHHYPLAQLWKQLYFIFDAGNMQERCENHAVVTHVNVEISLHKEITIPLADAALYARTFETISSTQTDANYD